MQRLYVRSGIIHLFVIGSTARPAGKFSLKELDGMDYVFTSCLLRVTFFVKKPQLTSTASCSVPSASGYEATAILSQYGLDLLFEAPAGEDKVTAASEGGREPSDADTSSELTSSVADSQSVADAEMTAALERAAKEIGLELDDWFLGNNRDSTPCSFPVPFFPKVHEELTKSWKAPFSARTRYTNSSNWQTATTWSIKEQFPSSLGVFHSVSDPPCNVWTLFPSTRTCVGTPLMFPHVLKQQIRSDDLPRQEDPLFGSHLMNLPSRTASGPLGFLPPATGCFALSSHSSPTPGTSGVTPLRPLVESFLDWLNLPNPSRWLLRNIRLGYAIQFARCPPRYHGVLFTSVQGENAAVLRAEIAVKDFGEGCDRNCPLSPYFIVPKKGGGLRQILYLRVLSRALHKLPFKMLTLKHILTCVRVQDWFVAIDLKDAYFHVSILPRQAIPAICLQRSAYQYKVLLFGLSLSPRVFTNLDDWLIPAHSRDLVCPHRDVDLAPAKPANSPKLRVSLFLISLQGKWRFQPQTVQLSRLGQAQVDLFASPESTHCQLWNGLTEAPLGIDALALSWPRDLHKYAFPPVSVIAQTLCKVREDREHVLLDLLSQGKGTIWLPCPDLWNLHQEDFRDLPPSVVNTLLQDRALSTRWLYGLKLHLFMNWCSSQGKDPQRCGIESVPSVLQGGLDRHLSASTLKVHVAAISANHDLMEGRSVLQQDPSEPLQSVDLNALSLKTALLTALTSFKRVGDLQALSINGSCLEFGLADSHVLLRPWSGYMPKVPTTPFRDQVVTLQAIPSQEGDSRGQQKGKAVSKQRISHWLVDAIRMAYQARGLPCPLGVRAHSTRGVAASAAFVNGASLTDICRAAGWATPNTFARFYNLRIGQSIERGVERERETVNPERSWSGAVIKCTERGGEIVGAPLRSHTLFSTFPCVNPEQPFHHLALLDVAKFGGGTCYKNPVQVSFPSGNSHCPNVLKTLSRSTEERPGCRTLPVTGQFLNVGRSRKGSTLQHY
ncbi:Transposon Ty3-G Gag-Pol polyprotein [Labeo rohita]|uniref:Transposon Ty3-G Gag-Pol polyprotein n=1 Tax=Labeo rohita TaxID=84645 RepID=A0ABQ8M4U6_LABRO|nr:Transposon Ty3-G Gag-Pol polyprotein [Labeo rohita]